jgi:hypothetical protein
MFFSFLISLIFICLRYFFCPRHAGGFAADTLNRMSKAQENFSVNSKYPGLIQNDVIQRLMAVNFKDIKLFHVKLGIGINYNLFTDVPFEFGNE